MLSWAGMQWGALLLAAILAAVVIVIRLVARWLLVRMVLGKAEVTIQPQRARLGEVLSIHYRQPIKQSRRLERFVLSLICREWVQYTRGTKTYHDRYEVTAAPHVVLENSELTAGGQLASQLTMQVPPGAMHSVRFKHNRVEWAVRSEIRILRYPRYTQEWPIDVLPLLVPPGTAAEGRV